jgi:replicative DNA helicase
MAESHAADRVPPHDADAEAALLGAMLIDHLVVNDVADRISPDDFYVAAHRHVYDAILALERSGRAVDVITVKDELKARAAFDKAGGADGLARLMETVTSSAAARHHAGIVRDHACVRGLLRAVQTIGRDAFENRGDVSQLLDRAEQQIFAVRGDETRDVGSIGDLIKEEIGLIEQRQNHHGPTGIDTGFADMNRMLGGLRNGELIIVAARPSMGKTTFALNMLSHAAVREKLPVLLFSLEVSKTQVAENILCSLAGKLDVRGEGKKIKAQNVRNGELSQEDWPALLEAANVLSEAPIFIDDTPGLSVLAARAKARRLASRHGIRMIVVDYMQLMTSPGAESRQNEISQISQGLKTLARELNVPVIALSQLNRAVETRNPPRPLMSDLRESGSIEQDADIVMFLYREAYYKDPDQILDQVKNLAEVIVGKHRNGPTGAVKLLFFGERLRFEDPARFV